MSLYANPTRYVGPDSLGIIHSVPDALEGARRRLSGRGAPCLDAAATGVWDGPGEVATEAAAAAVAARGYAAAGISSKSDLGGEEYKGSCQSFIPSRLLDLCSGCGVQVRTSITQAPWITRLITQKCLCCSWDTKRIVKLH